MQWPYSREINVQPYIDYMYVHTHTYAGKSCDGFFYNTQSYTLMSSRKEKCKNDPLNSFIIEA